MTGAGPPRAFPSPDENSAEFRVNNADIGNDGIGIHSTYFITVPGPGIEPDCEIAP
jgi:hypothetical protein